MGDAFAHYHRFVNNHYAGNETWSDNIHDLYHHLCRARNTGEAAHINDALAVIHDMRAALGALEDTLITARKAAA
jgi:hypothetical protein